MCIWYQKAILLKTEIIHVKWQQNNVERGWASAIVQIMTKRDGIPCNNEQM